MKSVAQLQAVLEDTQAALAAALAKIEGCRIRERQLVKELNQLRQVDISRGEEDRHQEHETAESPTSQVAEAAKLDHPLARKASHLRQWTSVSSAPVLVTNVDAEHPINIVEHGKRIPCSLIVSKEQVQVVDVKARVVLSDCLGLTSSLEAQQVGGGPSVSVDGQWQLTWQEDSHTQRKLVFEASSHTCEALDHLIREAKGLDEDGDTSGKSDTSHAELSAPVNLEPQPNPIAFTGEPSSIAKDTHLQLLASCMKGTQRFKSWQCTYDMTRHGISLQTLYRRQTAGVPSLLLVRDTVGFVFGCFSPDSWKVSPRFYGSGECFVFQLEPYRVMYPWKSKSKVKNDFFQYATPECFGMGGCGRFAICIDSELLQGSSAVCGTFGSPCLAHKEEFKIAALEVWQMIM